MTLTCNDVLKQNKREKRTFKVSLLLYLIINHWTNPKYARTSMM